MASKTRFRLLVRLGPKRVKIGPAGLGNHDFTTDTRVIEPNVFSSRSRAVRVGLIQKLNLPSRPRSFPGVALLCACRFPWLRRTKALTLSKIRQTNGADRTTQNIHKATHTLTRAPGAWFSRCGQNLGLQPV